MTNKATIDARRQFLQTLQKDLNLLLLDLDVASSHQYLYIVDFAAIYAYVYRSVAPATRPAIPEDTIERSYARRHVALDLVFSGNVRPLLLITPYATELRNHLKLLAMKAKLTSARVGPLFRERLSRIIETSPEFELFSKLADEESLIANSALQAAALQIGREYFPELYSVVTSLSSKGLQTIQSLFQKKILEDADSIIPQCRGFEASVDTTAVDDWYYKIVSRRHSQRTYQSFIDALACEYVVKANSKLNGEGKVVVFVSPSYHVQSVLEDQACVNVSGFAPFGPVRDLTYFLLSLTHKGDRQRVRISLDTVNELVNIYSRLTSAHSAEAKDLAREAEAKWTRSENLLLMTEVELPTQELVEHAASLDRSFLSVLRNLSQAVQASRPELEEEIRQSVIAFREATLELDKTLPSNTEALKSIRIRPVADKVVITFPGFSEELPISISFAEETIHGLALELKRRASHRTSEALLHFRKQVLSLASASDSTTERHLLAAYVLGMEGKYEGALVELNRGMPTQDPSTKRECLYLMAVLRRKLSQFDEAVVVLDEGIQEDPEDPRLYLERAKSTWWRFRTSGGSRSELIDASIADVGMVDALNRKQTPLKEFAAEAGNVAAFLYTERALARRRDPDSDLDVARRHIRDIERLVSRDQWSSRFFDTRARYYYALAMLRSVNTATRHEMLDKARADAERALERLEQGVETRRRLLQQHLEEIEEATRQGGGETSFGNRSS